MSKHSKAKWTMTATQRAVVHQPAAAVPPQVRVRSQVLAFCGHHCGRCSCSCHWTAASSAPLQETERTSFSLDTQINLQIKKKKDLHWIVPNIHYLTLSFAVEVQLKTWRGLNHRLRVVGNTRRRPEGVTPQHRETERGFQATRWTK